MKFFQKAKNEEEVIVGNFEHEEAMKSQEIELLKKKIADILDRLTPTRITWKAIEEKLRSDEVVALQARGDDLREQSDKLSITIVPTEISEARVRRFDRQYEDFLADGNVGKAREIEQEKLLFLQEREKTFETIRGLNSQIEAIDEEIRAKLRPLFFDSMLDIKSEAAKQLGLVLSFLKSEITHFAALQERYGIKLPFNPLSEVKMYSEGPFKTLRERLQAELLP
jgi:hypothetical protein